MSTETRFRACPLCEAICGLELRFDDGVLQAIRGDKDDPFSRGHICPKGNAIIDLERDPDRLRQPLRRRGRDWETIGWDEALAEAGERLAAVQREHGEDAVGVYLGNPNVHHFGHIAYLPPLLRALRTRNRFSASSVDQWPHQLVNLLMYGHQWLLPRQAAAQAPRAGPGNLQIDQLAAPIFVAVILEKDQFVGASSTSPATALLLFDQHLQRAT